MKRLIARMCCLLMAIGAGSYLLLAERTTAGLQAALDKTVPRAAASAAPHGPISTATKRIEQIRSGDMVMAADPASGVVEPRRVTRTFRRTSRHVQILRVRDSNGSEQRLETTAEHPFWVSGAGWRRAGDLTPGDQLVGPNGEAAVLKETARQPKPEGVAVYNFEVEGLHTYFVAAQGVRGPPLLVHNECDLPFAPLDDLVQTGRTVTREVASRNAGVLALPHELYQLGPINATPGGLKHVFERHVPGGIKSAGKSLFGAGEDVRQLIDDAQKVAATMQARGNWQRIIDAGRAIGTDRVTGQLTSKYTVITNRAGDLITAFPGLP